MTARRQYRTKAGVLVEAQQRVRVKDRRGRSCVKIAAYRVDTGGFMGWLWLKNLREVGHA